jgi:hypothetical protein
MEEKLTILISTFNERILQVKNVILDYREDVKYIVSHQYTDNKYKSIPPELNRKDILISQIEGRGVTKSRNNAIRLANTPLSLIADDDVTYKNEYFDTVINYFYNNASVDVAIFKIKTPKDAPEYKKYSKTSFQILDAASAKVSSVEMAFRTRIIKERNIVFDERFGVGQPLLIGSEERIFVSDCLKKRLNIWYFPEYIVEHPYESTIKLMSDFDKRKVYVAGAYDARVNGFLSIPKAFYVTFRLLNILKRNKKPPLLYLKERLSASIYILKTNKKYV